MDKQPVTYIVVGGQRRILGQPIQDGEIEAFVKNQLSKGVTLREETPYIWADFFRIPVQMVMDIIEKVQGES